MKEIRIGLLGCGSMGTGVAQTLEDHADLLADRTGARLVLTRVADLDLDRDRGLKLPKSAFTTDAHSVVDDPDIDIIIELIGGATIAKSLMLRAFDNGKHVVTANKALLATHGEEIFAAAHEQGVDFGFEASVAGGIPIIRALRDGLVANRITSIKGIMNGTSNYILSRMTDDGGHFDTVLKEAQAAGYAEADPTYDVDGTDPAHKIAVLIGLAFGVSVQYEEIPKRGIADITPLDISFAKELGYRIKLLAVAKSAGARIEVRVEPSLVPASHHLATVGGAMNAVYVEGEPIGETMLYGPGAGGGPAGSAVVADVVEVARRMVHGVSPASVFPRGFARTTFERVDIVPETETAGAYYLRFNVLDEPGSLAAIARILGEQNISIEQVVQHGRQAGEAVPVVMLTHEATSSDLIGALTKIDALASIKAPSFWMRLEN